MTVSYFVRVFVQRGLALALTLAASAHAQTLELAPGDTLAILGNRLAEDMQHAGFFDARVTARFPNLGARVRNLGFSGDEVGAHQRTMNFGKFSDDALDLNLPEDPFLIWDRYLEHESTDAIVACFGGCEYFAGLAGIDGFRADLTRFVSHVESTTYNGKVRAGLWLVAPLPAQRQDHQTQATVDERNSVLAAYGDVMREVARAKQVGFVDLFDTFRAAFEASDAPLTSNGVHLNEAGAALFAQELEAALFGTSSPPPTNELLEAVREKNGFWFRRYQAVDGYNLYGHRSRLTYNEAGGDSRVTNFEVLQREMDRLDAVVDARERSIRAGLLGLDAADESDSLPALLPVRTNKPGPLEGGAYAFLSGEASLEAMTAADGLAVNLFCDEAQFPDFVNPVQMAWDTRGRLWVLTWPSYPSTRAEILPHDKLLVLEDVDGDGRADTCEVFADDLHNPTGLEFWNGGVFVATAPSLLFLKDTTGDGHCDQSERVLTGLSSADTHHAANSFVFGPDGALYFQEGTFHRSQVETPNGVLRNRNGCVWRFEPRTNRLERYIPYNFANPHGHVFDSWGQDFMTDGTGNVNYYSLPFSGFLPEPHKKSRYFSFFGQRSRPAGGTEILSSAHFPDTMQGNYLIANVIGFRGIFQYEVSDDGSGFSANEVQPIVESTDPNFRPVDLEIGPDGALYFLDWHNPIIGHMQHHIRDPSRDALHGRVYRVTHPGRELLKTRALAGQPLDQLLRALESPNDRVRYRARIELSQHAEGDVLPLVLPWIATIVLDDPARDHHVLEAAWLHQQFDVFEPVFVNFALASKNPRARAAAVRCVRQTRHLNSDALEMLQIAATDEHPRVRLEALVGASFFADDPRALHVALAVGAETRDRFIDYALNETLRALEPMWRTALTDGTIGALSTRHQVLLDRLSDAELQALPFSQAVQQNLLLRPSIKLEQRRRVARKLAASQPSPGRPQGMAVAELLLATLSELEAGEVEAHVVKELGALMLEDCELPAIAFKWLATEGSSPETRAVGFAGLVSSPDGRSLARELSESNVANTHTLLRALDIVQDRAVLPEFWPLAESLAHGQASSGTDGSDSERCLAIRAMRSIPGHDEAKLLGALEWLSEPTLELAPVELLESMINTSASISFVEPVITRLAQQLESLPVAERTSAGALRRTQLARDLGVHLTADERGALDARLALLSGTSITIGALPHRMLYDVDSFFVEAGSAVAIDFVNSDSMPHNLVIVQPGTRQTVGEAAEAMAAKPDAEARAYIPASDAVLFHTQLVRPGERERLTFQAPSEPGVYPYLCTYPGHWRVMQGTLHVVAKLDAEQREFERADAGEASARSFVREWKFDELATLFDGDWRAGRSLARGETMFTEAGCLTCHCTSKGYFAGPDLGQLRPELKGRELLRHILEPSREIAEGYAYEGFEYEDGSRSIGRVLAEDDTEFTLVQVNGTEAMFVQKADVVDRWKVDLSPMPTGMLVTLESDEILDLVRFVEEQGQPETDPLWLDLPGAAADSKLPGAGLHVVLLAGDEEYRSEECLPMLARIMSERFGFRATVLFSIDPSSGVIDPTESTNIPGIFMLEDADLVICSWRFRELNDVDMSYFAGYVEAGKPIVGLRTATHAFNYPSNSASPYAHYSYNSAEWPGGFGRQVLGETWVAHHGQHKVQSTRAMHSDSAGEHPILTGVGEPWAPTDVYAVGQLPDDARVLLRGAVLDGMTRDSKVVDGAKNAPMMPVAWLRERATENAVQRVVCTTMGASQDFVDEHLRRFVINASLWCVGREDRIDGQASVELVGPYEPTEFGFGSFTPDMRVGNL